MLLPKIINTLKDQSSATKREVALTTLGQLIKSTGYVIAPFTDYPQLLELLLNEIKTELVPHIRCEVLKVVGIIGAIDPYKYKITLLRQSPLQQQQLTNINNTNVTYNNNNNINNNINNNNNNNNSMTKSNQYFQQQQQQQYQQQQQQSYQQNQQQLHSFSEDDILDGISPSSEDYYPTVAIAKLLRILRDPSLSPYHSSVVEAMTSKICSSLGSKCIKFLPEIMPLLLHTMSHCESIFRRFLFQQVAVLVSIAKQHVRDYLDDIFLKIKEFWREPYIPNILSLIEEISSALKDEFKCYLPDLLPQILDSIQYPIEAGSAEVPTKVLQALENFGTQLSDYIHMVLPAVVRMFETITTPIYIRRLAINSMERLCKKLNFSDYASRIIHPLARVLNEGGELIITVMDCLSALAYQLGSEFCAFLPMIDKIIIRQKIQHQRYLIISKKLNSHEPLLPEDIGESFSSSSSSSNNNNPGGNNSNSNSNNNNSSSYSSSSSNDSSEPTSIEKIKVNQLNLKKVWDASHKSTKADWSEWLRKFSVELLRECPSPALRSCKNAAQQYHPLARELFNASFYSCWNELYDANKDHLILSLQTALINVPPKILQTLLNLAEFMEHHDMPLPINVNILSELAVKCNALAKALRYKESEFRDTPTDANVASLITIYNELQQHEAAMGILEYTQKNHNIKLNESWFEKLQQWNEALEHYDRKYFENNNDHFDILITKGRMKCQYALGRWEELSNYSKEVWKFNMNNDDRNTIATLAAAAAWNLGEWNILEEFITAIDVNQFNGSFYRAILYVHKDKYSDAKKYIEKARDSVDASLTALVAESYGRAYDEVVNVQLLSELEELIEYKQITNTIQLSSSSSDSINPLKKRQSLMKETWKKRLFGSQPNVDLWQRMLSMRAMVVPPNEDISTWLKFISLCRKSSRFSIAQKVISNLIGFDFNKVPENMKVNQPEVAYSYLKHLWAIGKQNDALLRMRTFVDQLDDSNVGLLAKCFLKLGQWQLELLTTSASPNTTNTNTNPSTTSSKTYLLEQVIPNVLVSFRSSTRYDKNWYKAWHMWALTNFSAIQLSEEAGKNYQNIRQYISQAIQGFFRSIALAPPGENLQDTLRLLTLWFQYGSYEDVQISIGDGFTTVSIDNWLQVIPQIIARIHTGATPVRKMIHDLLARIGEVHPQALLYSLHVASKSPSKSRRAAAIAVIDTLRVHSPLLIEESQMVAQELIRVAILWNEMWHEALEDASRQYFGENNIDGMFEILAPLHEMMNKGAETTQEINFQQQFGKILMDADQCCKKYKVTKRASELDKAWEYYYDVFRKIDKQLKYHQNQFELQQISPKLDKCAIHLHIAMPGTYRANYNVVTIQSFDNLLTVISSKQRPRKLKINGSDGQPYHFLLKGHEDLRQDERVMQLFGLVNTLLESNLETAKRHLNIQRYSVCPLSPNSGLIGWVPQHDTLHALIRDYRESKKIVLNIEHRLINNMTADYDNLTLIQKVEVFENALEYTNGMDLDRILWLKSRNSETWLDRRTNYTRSLAVMSMVGYILGLGDRHPSNLMLHRITGKILHIDFGDCFEVAMFREKFPEKIPFRLTRMLRNAMEVSGIEGNFRYTCERVMEVMRGNKQSLMAVLEAFVHDPLLNWRLLTTSPNDLAEINNFDEPGVSTSLSQQRRRFPEGLF